MSTMNRPKFRTTRRTRDAGLLYYDNGAGRWVVYRRAGGVTRKTSLRGPLSDFALALRAAKIAARLKEWPAERLARFQFNP